MHATEYLKSPPATPPLVVALTGEERSLKLSVIDAIGKATLSEGETPTKFGGKDIEWQSIKSELQTVPMWGGKRVVVVEDANEFVTEHRSSLEAYSEKPAKKSILILDMKSLPANQKLHKIIAKSGAIIECSPLKGAALTRWIQDFASATYGKQIIPAACGLLVELVGNHIGHIEQELGKLASFVGDKPSIDVEAVRKLVGDWKSETTWAMNDATRDGRVADALDALEKLLHVGTTPILLLGGMLYTFKKYGTATELARQGMQLGEALTQAGAWGMEIGPATSYLRRIGRPKAELLLRHILDTDVGLKGGSALPDRAQLELLLLKLSGTLS